MELESSDVEESQVWEYVEEADGGDGSLQQEEWEYAEEADSGDGNLQQEEWEYAEEADSGSNNISSEHNGTAELTSNENGTPDNNILPQEENVSAISDVDPYDYKDNNKKLQSEEDYNEVNKSVQTYVDDGDGHNDGLHATQYIAEDETPVENEEWEYVTEGGTLAENEEWEYVTEDGTPAENEEWEYVTEDGTSADSEEWEYVTEDGIPVDSEEWEYVTEDEDKDNHMPTDVFNPLYGEQIQLDTSNKPQAGIMDLSALKLYEISEFDSSADEPYCNTKQ